MNISDLSIRRPVFATVVSLLLIVMGVMAFSRLTLRELPAIDPPVVSVDVTYAGASAAVVETRVTQILEDALSGTDARLAEKRLCHRCQPCRLPHETFMLFIGIAEQVVRNGFGLRQLLRHWSPLDAVKGPTLVVAPLDRLCLDHADRGSCGHDSRHTKSRCSNKFTEVSFGSLPSARCR